MEAVGGGMSKSSHRQHSSHTKSCFPYRISCSPVSTHCSLPISGSCWREQSNERLKYQQREDWSKRTLQAVRVQGVLFTPFPNGRLKDNQILVEEKLRALLGEDSVPLRASRGLTWMERK